MKILFYTTDMKFGGAQRVISILANTFAENGHSVKIFMYNEYDTIAYELNEKVSVVHLNSRFRIVNPVRDIFELRKTRKQVHSFSPDIIISFYAIDTVLIRLACMGKSIPVIYSQRCDPYNATFKEHLYEKVATRLARHIIFQSRGAQQYYPETIINKSEIIFNPLRTERLPQKTSIPDMRQGAKKSIVAVGRLSQQKNHAMLIKAFDHIKDDIPEHILQIFGDGPLKQHLQGIIAERGLQDRVFLMGNHTDVVHSMAKASLFVLPSLYEGQPNALLEAMCIGVPCISTDWSPKGTVTDLIKNGENGRIVFSMKDKDMSDAILELLSNKDLADTMGKNAASIAQKVNADHISRQWLETISNIIKR